MVQFDEEKSVIIGSHGVMHLPRGDKATLKLAMLLIGELSEIGPLNAAKLFNFSKQRYYQIRNDFHQRGVEALIDEKTGPKTNYRRTPEVEKIVIRARFLDPEATVDVITSQVVQSGFQISKRSVQRILENYGLQKKTPRPLPFQGSTTNTNTKKHDQSEY